MKNVTLLVWLTQLGLSVALPPAGFIFLAVWLRDSCGWGGWGGWVLWVGIVLGVVGAADGLRTSLKAMERMSRDKKKDGPPQAASFNDHD